MAGKVTAADIPVGLRFYKALIIEVATRYRLDPTLVAAICWQESNLQTDAYRFEPDFWNRYLKPKPEYRELNPRRVSASYGLLQVMYCRVHEDKLKENDALPPEHLFVPELGLATGCEFLVELFAWANSREVPSALFTQQPNVRTMIALAAYNGGRGGNDPAKNWPLRNASYVREVLEKFAVLKKEKAV